MPEPDKNLEPPVALRPLSPLIGVEVQGLDPTKPVSNAVARQVHRALVDHSILLFRGLDLSPRQQIDFSRAFGELEQYVVEQFLLPDHPEIVVISNVVENGRHIGAHGGARFFHSDQSYNPDPPIGSLLYCLECPPEGGQTEFASMFAAYDALDDDRRQWLESQRGVDDYVYHYETYLTHREPLTAEQKAKLPPTTHPAIMAHPETGRKAVYVAHAITSHFEGMDVAESRPIIKQITVFATQERFVYRHEWRPGDMIFWDNRSTMHRALPFDETKHRRRMHRTTVRSFASR